ncbi:MAG: hypothetical protein KDJ52_27400 [Anaerolineae bacterium]|nr:hypothetical protein [Anaerolineae bacterium]
MQGLQQRLIWGSRIQLALAQGQAETALQWIERLMAATVNLPSYSLQGKTEEAVAVPHLSLLHGQALLALDRLDEAEATLQAGIAAVIPQGRLGLQWRLYALLAQVYRAKKQHPQADQAVEAAQSVIDTLAAGILDASLRDNFLQQVANHLPARTPPSPQTQAKQHFDGLTARERQVAALVAQGQTNRDIAETLILSERTAERHVANIMAKLGVNSRAQIAVWAVEKGLTANS